MKLIASAITKLFFGLLFSAALVFLPAGTLAYTGGLIFTAVLFVPMIGFGAFLALKKPGLLEKELDGYLEYKTNVKYKLIPKIY